MSRWLDLPPEKLCPEILLASFYVYPPPFAPWVNIPGLNLYLVIEGEARFTCADGATGTVGKNDMFAFYAGLNGYEVIGDAPILFYQVVFLPAASPLQEGIPCIEGCGRLPHLVHLGDRAPEGVAIYERMIESLLRLDLTWKLETASAILDLLKLVFSVLARDQPHRPQRLNKWERLLARLETDRDMPATQDLANDLNVSVQHFIREFYRHTGKTPKQYVLQRHLCKARHLLLEGALVKEAANQSGFRDPLYFSRAYRKQFGYPPSQARRHAETVDNLEPDTSLPVCRHLLAPGVDTRIFRPPAPDPAHR